MVTMDGIHKMLVRKANREDPDQTAEGKTLIRLLSRSGSALLV